MPLSGGSSDKIPNRYEKRWTLYCLTQVLKGKYETIYLEPPDETKAEFALLNNNETHYHQVKRQLTTGTWTFNKLNSEKLIEAFGNNIADNSIHWCFISSYPAPILDELTENAKSANDSTDFLTNFVSSSKARKDYFSKLKNSWSATESETYHRLQNITVITISEEILSELNDTILERFYDKSDIAAVRGILKEFIDNNIHKKVVASQVWKFLERNIPNIKLKQEHDDTYQQSTSFENSILNILSEDLKQLSNRLSHLIEQRLSNIDQRRREGISGNFFEELNEIKEDIRYFEILNPVTRVNLLCTMAGICIDNDDLSLAKQLIQKAKDIDSSPERILRIEAFIKAYKEKELDIALELLESTHEVHSRNLNAAILIEKGEYVKATEILKNISEENAETYRLLTVIAIKQGDLLESKRQINQANLLQPTWLNIKFAVAVVTFLETLTLPAVDDCAVQFPFPPLLERPLLKLDKKSIRIYEDAHNLFQNLTEYHDKEVQEPHIWCLACLIYNPNTQAQASDFCQNLLDTDPAYAPTIMWAIVCKLNVNFQPSKLELEQLEKNSQIDLYQKLALAEIYLVLEELKMAKHYLEKIKNEFQKSRLYRQWEGVYMRTLLKLQDTETLETVTSETEKKTEDLFHLNYLVLEDKAKKTGDLSLVTNLLRTRYENTYNAIDLLLLCINLYENAMWEEFDRNSENLLKNIDSSDTNRMAIIASFYSRKYKRCLELIDRYNKTFEPTLSKFQLLDLQSHCYEEIGDLKNAIKFAQRLLIENPTPTNLHNLAYLYHKTGDFSAIETLSARLFEPTLYDSAFCLSFAQFLQHHNRERAVALWRHSYRQGIPDLLVSTAYLLAVQLNLYNEAQDLSERFSKLTYQNIGGRFITLQEFINIQSEDYRIWEQVKSKYFEGTIGFHNFVDAVGVNLILQYSLNFSASFNKPLLERGNSIFARHGSKAIIHPQPESIEDTHLFADITGILLAHQLGVLSQIEEIFKPINIPQSLIPALSYIRQQVVERNNRFPSHDLQTILNLIVRNEIQVVDTKNIDVLDDIKDELTETQAVFLSLAKRNGGVFIDRLPLTKISAKSGNLEMIPAEIPAIWDTYMANRESVLLGIQGQITRSQYLEALEKLRDVSSSVISRSIPAGRKLYFGNQIVFDFVFAKVLSQICESFQVFVSKEFHEQILNELEFNKNFKKMTNSLNSLIRHLNSGILNDTYKTLPNPSPQQYIEESPLYTCLITLIEVPTHDNYAIWIDDRFVNGLRVGNNPSVGINDLLSAMLSAGKLSEDDYYSYLLKLRAANIRYIPLEIEELLYHLKIAVNDGNSFTESLELRILKKYVAACMYDPIDIQHPTKLPKESINQQGELFFVGSLKLNIYRLFPRIWFEFETSEIRYQVAMWVRNNLFFDYMAMIEYEHDLLENYAHDRLIPDLSAICLQYIQIVLSSSLTDEQQVLLTEDYVTWMWNNILSPYVLVESQLLRSIAERMKNQLIDLYENTDIGDSKLLLTILYEVYLNLPESIRDLLMEDQEFIKLFSLKLFFKIDDLVFDAKLFWRGVSRAFNDGDTITVGEFDLNIEKSDNHITIVLTDTDNKKRTFRYHYGGIFSDDTQEIYNSIKSKQHSLDCSNEEISALSKKIANINEPLYRVHEVDNYIQTSSTNFYPWLVDTFRNLNENSLLHFDDLLPDSLHGLVRHFRLTLDNSISFSENLSQASVTLLEDYNLVTSFQRLVSFPVPLPEQLIDEFVQSDSSTRHQILEIIIGSQSPVAIAHALKLYSLVEEHNKLELLMESITSTAGIASTRAFLKLVQFVQNLFATHKEIDEIVPNVALSLIWSHSHNIYAILKNLGFANEDIENNFQYPVFTPQQTFERVFSALNDDIAIPLRVSERQYILSTLSYALDSANRIEFTEDIINNIKNIIFNDYEKGNSFHWSLCRNLAKLSNVTGSILDNEWTNLLSPYFANLPSQVWKRDVIQNSLDTLQTDLYDIQAWANLHNVVRDLPLHDALFEKLEDLLLSVDYFQFYVRDKNLGFYSTDLALHQLIHITNPVIHKQLAELLPKLADYFSSKFDAMKGELTDEQLNALILNTLIFPIFKIARASDEYDATIIKLCSEISVSWKYTVSYIYVLVENAYDRSPIDSRPQYWKLLLHLKFQDK